MLLLLNIQHLFKYKCNTIFVVSFIYIISLFWAVMANNFHFRSAAFIAVIIIEKIYWINYFINDLLKS